MYPLFYFYKTNDTRNFFWQYRIFSPTHFLITFTFWSQPMFPKRFHTLKIVNIWIFYDVTKWIFVIPWWLSQPDIVSCSLDSPLTTFTFMTTINTLQWCTYQLVTVTIDHILKITFIVVIIILAISKNLKFKHKACIYISMLVHTNIRIWISTQRPTNPLLFWCDSTNFSN